MTDGVRAPAYDVVKRWEDAVRFDGTPDGLRPDVASMTEADLEETDPTTLGRKVAAARRALDSALARVPGYGFSEGSIGISARYSALLRGPLERRRRPREGADATSREVRVAPMPFDDPAD